jgi:Methyltransferase domain
MSPFLGVLTFPHRARLAARSTGRHIAVASRWLVRSREFANFSYDLTDLNKEQLVWFVAAVTETDVATIRTYVAEIEDNAGLREYVQSRLRASRRHRELDRSLYYGRRVGWYAIIRALQPTVVVETGTEKGLGSLVIAEALKANGQGHLYTIDIEKSSGLLIGPEYKSLVTRICSDSVIGLQTIDKIDLFLHDSDHSAEHERNEFDAAAARLTPSAIVLSDNSHATNELAEWSAAHNRKFHYFAERPRDHWYPGAGIGLSR